MSVNKWFITQPDNIREKRLVQARDTDLLVKVTARVFDEDCDPSTKEDEFDFTGHTPSFELFTNKVDTIPLLTIASGMFTITQDANGALEGVNNVLEVPVSYDNDIVANSIPLGVDLWYRVYIEDAASLPYVIQRGPYHVERF